MAHQIVLEVKGYARGRQFLNKELARVRVDDGAYRPARDQSFDDALAWLQNEGFELIELVGPATRMGTGTATYIYRREDCNA
jgi:hypothetical protein